MGDVLLFSCEYSTLLATYCQSKNVLKWQQTCYLIIWPIEAPGNDVQNDYGRQFYNNFLKQAFYHVEHIIMDMHCLPILLITLRLNKTALCEPSIIPILQQRNFVPYVSLSFGTFVLKAYNTQSTETHIDGVMQGRGNSSTLAIVLRPSYTNPSI